MAFQTMPLVRAGVDSELHKLCIDVKDYEGCIRVHSGQSNNEQIEANGTDLDFLGMPKIQGWVINEVPQKNVVTYINPKISKVKVRGVYGRYFHIERVVRFYQNPKAATTGYSTTLGSSQTNCYSYSENSIDCTTKAPTTIDVPGKPAVPGGIRQFYYDYIVDCAEGTLAAHVNGKVNSGWSSVRGTFAESYSKQLCPDINSLPKSSFNKYAGGSPNEKDLSIRNSN